MATSDDMNREQARVPLEDVLDAYVAASEHPDPQVLQEWMTRYPYYAQELADFTVSWSLMLTLPPSPGQSHTEEETLVLRGMSVVQNLLHAQLSTVPVNEPPLAGLITTGNTHGFSIQQLADAVELSVPLLGKLDRRLIRYLSIPHEVIDLLARALHCVAAVVERYLQGAPIFAAGAQHHASTAPTLAEQEDFFEAVRHDRALSPERRVRWLALAPNDE
jgi:hypothetical protein